MVEAWWINVVLFAMLLNTVLLFSHTSDCLQEILASFLNLFTPKSDQCQMFPCSLSRNNITSYSIKNLNERWLYKFSLPHLYCTFSLKGWENVLCELWSNRVKLFLGDPFYITVSTKLFIHTIEPRGNESKVRLTGLLPWSQLLQWLQWS